ncbi:nucleotide exchange factor GrpE [Mariniblastus fucicola]|uniref:Protein GrpE n=1 Tax=Mariniblastus fucicola TaxID=980251 RepID=A0A5B9PBB7_9BACT|nr:nucleotide exchange factor GrpE [Mariniblastus fucicola]QEG23584.1 heat shock protein GrpE [Mariniblastus fucicola]
MTDENEPTENPELELPTEDQVNQFGNDNAGDEGVAFAVDGADAGADVIQKLQDQLKDAEKRVLMAQADLENFRRRVRRESEDRIKYASSGLMTDLLESVDNLHRAVEAYEADPNGDGLRDGVNLVASQIMESLSKHGCQPIEAAGQAFDPNCHQALQMQPSPEHPANTVIQDLRTGFKLYDRVLRPSQVFVSTGEPA